MPYRDSHDPYEHVRIEMLSACSFLHAWKKYKPIIAGGALWSWAAQVPARDIDFFVHNTWGVRRRIRSMPALRSEADDLYPSMLSNDNDGYGGTWQEGRIPVVRYLGQLYPGKPMDLVLTGWKGLAVVDHFDYSHCKVAFDGESFKCEGAIYYSKGNLHNKYTAVPRRDHDYVRAKVQPTLWGSPDAANQLDRVFIALRDAYLKSGGGRYANDVLWP